MNRRQILVLVVGILFLVELYLATDNVHFSKWQLVAGFVIAVIIIGGIIYWLRDRKNASQDE